MTTPGAVRGWYDLHARYGRVDIAELLAPAIRLAEDGFAVGPIAAREWKFFDSVIGKDPACAALYRAGNTPAAGETFTNPELAATLRAIAEDGPSAFYEGAPAKAAARASAGLRRRARDARLRRPSRQFRHSRCRRPSAA